MYRWIFLMLLVVGLNSQAQQWKAWTSASVNLGLSKKTYFNLGALHSFNVDDLTKNFQQFNGQLGRNINKRNSISTGTIINISNSHLQSRVYARYNFRSTLFKKITWTNAVQAEWHSRWETNYRY